MKHNEDETDKACSAHRGKEECVWDFGRKARKKETTRWEDNIETDLR
jgi:hypothetical protein